MCWGWFARNKGYASLQRKGRSCSAVYLDAVDKLPYNAYTSLVGLAYAALYAPTGFGSEQASTRACSDFGTPIHAFNYRGLSACWSPCAQAAVPRHAPGAPEVASGPLLPLTPAPSYPSALIPRMHNHSPSSAFHPHILPLTW